MNMASLLDQRLKAAPFMSPGQKIVVFTQIANKAAELYTDPFPRIESKQRLNKIHTRARSTTASFPFKTRSTKSQSGQNRDKIRSRNRQKGHRASRRFWLKKNFIVAETTVEQKQPVELAEEHIQKYKSIGAFPVNSLPLDWWKKNESQYPMIAALARSLFAIPETSVPSERVFSTAGDILIASRSTLKPHLVDMMLFLKKNM